MINTTTKNQIYHALPVCTFYSLFFLLFFFPITFSSRFFLSDGLLAAFHTPVETWTNAMFSGHPRLANIHWSAFYPLKYLFSLLPNGYNLFTVTAYVLSSSFTYGYIYTITRSRLAALFGGTVFGMCGFMIGHLGHSAMIQSAVWLPLILWALEILRRTPSIPWFVIASIGVAMSITAGHPQIVVYSLMVAIAYVLFSCRNSTIGSWRYAGICIGALMFGCALAAIQLLPTTELANLSIRKELTFERFSNFSLPPFYLILFLFPYIFGGVPRPC